MAEVNKIPQYRKMYELLRKHIVDGVYEEGALLPSENELCAVHNVTRPTVRQALQQLVNDGYILKQQGKGSIVRPLPKGIGILSIQGTTSSFGDKKLETNIIEKPKVIPWPEDFVFELDELERESGCIFFDRQRIVEGVKVLYDVSYIPNIGLPRFTQKGFINQSLFDILRSSYNIEVLGGQQRIKSIRADEKISKYLDVELGGPVLQLERVIETSKVGFRFFSILYCNTEAYYLEGSF